MLYFGSFKGAFDIIFSSVASKPPVISPMLINDAEAFAALQSEAVLWRDLGHTSVDFTSSVMPWL